MSSSISRMGFLPFRSTRGLGGSDATGATTGAWVGMKMRKAVLGAPYSPIGGRLTRYAWVFPPMALASVVVELGD